MKAGRGEIRLIWSFLVSVANIGSYVRSVLAEGMAQVLLFIGNVALMVRVHCVSGILVFCGVSKVGTIDRFLDVDLPHSGRVVIWTSEKGLRLFGDLLATEDGVDRELSRLGYI